MNDEKKATAFEADPEINILEILQLLVKRKLFIAVICCATAILTAAYSLTLPNVYAATAKVLPPQKEGSSGLSAMLGQMGGLAGFATGGKGGASDSEIYLSILRSRSVADEVIKRLDLAKVLRLPTLDQTRELLGKTLKAEAGKDGIITITVENTDPKLAALLANTFADELGRTLVRLNLTKVGTERLFLEKRLDLVKSDLKRAEDALKVFSQQNKIVQVDTQAKATVDNVSRIKSEIAGKEVQLAVLRSSQTDDSFEVKSLRVAIQRLKGELKRYTNGGGDEVLQALGSVPEVGLEYSRKVRDLKIQETLFEQLSKQYEMAKLNEAKDSSTLQVLDEALVPTQKVKPRRSSMVLLSICVSFFVSVILVLFLGYLERMSDEERETFNRIKKQAFSFR